MQPRLRGFTIVELLIVIVIIGILAAITLVAYSGMQQRGRDSARLSDLSGLAKALELYKTDNGSYPNCSGGTYQPGTASSFNSVATCLTPLVPTYISRLPRDPLNTGSSQYWYAVGYRKSGATGQVNDQSNNYMLGAKLERTAAPNYTGWFSYTDLNYLSGSNN